MTDRGLQSPPAAPEPSRVETGRHRPDSPSPFVVLGAITSQVALITGLLFYFGWTASRAYYDYFGVDVRALGYSTSDYLLSSISVTYWPAVASLLPFLVLLGVHRLVVAPALTARSQARAADSLRPAGDDALSHDQRLLRRAMTVAFGVSIGLIVSAVVAIVLDASLGIVLPVMLVVGVVLLAYLVVLGTVYHAPLTINHAPTQTASNPWILPLVLLGLGFLAAFWAVGLYGDHQGQRRAEATAHNLGKLTTVEVFSVNDLAIFGGGSQHDAIPLPTYRHRFSGLLMLAHSPDKYFLLPQDWQRCRDLVFVVADNETVRVNLKVNRYGSEESPPQTKDQGPDTPPTDSCQVHG